MESRMFCRMLLIGIFALTFAVPPGVSHGAAAGSAAEFYKGKTLTWVVSSEPGGSTDIIARIFSGHLGREIGAKVLVKNMTGGSMEGDNWTFSEAKRDGLTGLTEGTGPLLLNDLLKSAGVQYVTEKFIFLAGVIPNLTAAAVSPKGSYKTLDALRRGKGVKIGASSAKGYIAVSGGLSAELLGLDARLVTGYKGMKSVLLAVTQGEMDMVVSSEQDIAQAAKTGDAVPLFILGDERSDLMSSVPTLKELGVAVPRELRDAYSAVAQNTRAMILPPGTPADRVAFMRTVFNKMNNMKAVQDEISRYAGCWRPIVPGERLQEEINRIKGNKSLGGQLEGILKKYSAGR